MRKNTYKKHIKNKKIFSDNPCYKNLIINKTSFTSHAKNKVEMFPKYKTKNRKKKLKEKRNLEHPLSTQLNKYNKFYHQIAKRILTPLL